MALVTTRGLRQGAYVILLFGGCLDELLEAPYILTSGFGEVRSVAPVSDGQLMVATTTGCFYVDGNGVVTRWADAADAVTRHPQMSYRAVDDTIFWEGGSMAAPGVVDIQAGDEALAILYPDRLVLDGRFGTTPHPERIIPLGRTDARAVALGPSGYLVVTETALLEVGAEVRILVEGLTDARAAALDAKGRVYVAAGAPAELWRVEGGQLGSVARWLGDPRDLHFGLGGLLPPENLYIANGKGSLDYLRPP